MKKVILIPIIIALIAIFGYAYLSQNDNTTPAPINSLANVTNDSQNMLSNPGYESPSLRSWQRQSMWRSARSSASRTRVIQEG
jgi:hypothetical protein